MHIFRRLLRNIIRFCLGFMISFVPMSTEAGAWQRDKGSGFISLSGHYTERLPDIFGYGAGTDRYVSLYAEYGLRPNLTLGLEAGKELDGERRTFVFTQKPIRQSDRGVQVTYGAGAGMIGDISWSVLRLSLGLGLPRGWAAAEGQVLLQNPEPGVVYDEIIYDWKLDVTYGRNFRKGRKGIVQLQTSRAFDEVMTVKFAPSYVMPLAGEKLHLEAGAAFGVKGETSRGLKFALWYAF